MPKFFRNIQDFSDALDNDLSWRKHELYLFNKSIPEQNTQKQKTFLRTAVPILYAHWEGFVNNASTNYLKFIKSKELRHNELQLQFITLSLRNKLSLLEAKNIETQTEIIHFLINEFNNKAHLPYKNIINTKSNLRFSVFKQILFLIGLDENNFLKYNSLVDDLVDLRNHIAHGRNSSIDKVTYDNFYAETVNLLTYFKTELENSVALEKYRKEIKLHTTAKL